MPVVPADCGASTPDVALASVLIRKAWFWLTMYKTGGVPPKPFKVTRPVSGIDFVLASGHLLLSERAARVLVKQNGSITEAISVGSAIASEQSDSANRFRASAIGVNPVGLENTCALQGYVGEARAGGYDPEYCSQRQR